jgi:integrase
LRACLDSARRKVGLHRNPCDDATRPKVKDHEIGQVLGATDLRRVVEAFSDSVLYPIVATAAFTGARLGELLAFRWSDLNPETRELRIERAIETTSKYKRVLKEPKSERSKRTIVLSSGLVELLLRERGRYLRLVAGVPDSADVDLALVKLPTDALMFPATATDLARLRNPHSVTCMTRTRFRQLGFPRLRFHDLRSSHASALLDAGTPIHTVAARLGHSPTVLMKAYAKRTTASDTSAADAIDKLMKGVLA